MRKEPVSSFLTILLTVGWYGVALVLALTACLLVVVLFYSVRGTSGGFHGTSEIDIPVSFTVDARALQVSAPALGVATAHIHNARGSLVFSAPAGASLAVPALLAFIIMLALILWGLGQLRAVFRTLRDGQPFVPANTARIRRIAYIVMLGELARTTIVFLANSFATTHFSAGAFRFDARPDLNAFAIIHGLIILAVAEVFKAGTRLHEDQSLTI